MLSSSWKKATLSSLSAALVCQIKQKIVSDVSFTDSSKSEIKVFIDYMCSREAIYSRRKRVG